MTNRSRSLIGISSLWAWPVTLAALALLEGRDARLFMFDSYALALAVICALVLTTAAELVWLTVEWLRDLTFFVGGFYLVGRFASAFDPEYQLTARVYVRVIVFLLLVLQGHVVAYLLARLTLLEAKARHGGD